MISKDYLKDLVYHVNGAAIEVHKLLGPGLLESVYHKCMKRELTIRKIPFQSELRIPIDYKKIQLNAELKCDFLIDGTLVVELKSCDHVLPVHKAQLLSYMRLLNCPKGLMINFNVVNLFKHGQQTFVNELYRALPQSSMTQKSRNIKFPPRLPYQ